MSKEVLTHSESYIKKTNRIILAVGITSFVIFILGLYLLFSSGDKGDEYTDPIITDNDDPLQKIETSTPEDTGIEFTVVDDGIVPITTTPNPIPLGQVVIGSDAKNVLTLGTNGKASVNIISVQLAEAPFDGFSFKDLFIASFL